VRKTRQVLNKTDIAVLVTDGTEELHPVDLQLLELFRAKEIPYLIVRNKADLLEQVPADTDREIWTSAVAGRNIHELKERMARLKQEGTQARIVADKLAPGDLAVLVVPIDKAAPKGRLILPQQQTIRDILEAGAGAVVVRDSELELMLGKLGRAPDLVITDSQVFGPVSKIVPRDVKLTSFSILMARYKGLLEEAVRGAAAVEGLKDGDTVLIAEGCTHHRQCDDIGTVKIPGWLRKATGKELNIRVCSGTEFPDDLSGIALVVHCGGCMLNEREVRYRMKCAADQGVPITNYGILIAHLNGILKRSVEIFPDLAAQIQ
jgi:[FeFe] hydrogenase H-cluster maturation GTPase HydF